MPSSFETMPEQVLGGNILSITNNGTNVNLYGYDLAGQLTNAVAFSNGVAGPVTNSWQYDEAGNWLNANTTNRWVYNPDNELTGQTSNSDTNGTNVVGYVYPGTARNKWYDTWAECRGVSARVSKRVSPHY